MFEMNSSEILIIVGPCKTGTTWLHRLLDSSGIDKEMRFPTKFGRDYVYRRFVQNESVLVWPYLLHQPDSLWSLLNKLREVNRPFRIYACWRSPASWRQSIQRFRARATNVQDASHVLKTERIVRDTLKKLKVYSGVTCLKLIEPRPRDLLHLQKITQLSTQELLQKSTEAVYVTNDTARLNSQWLGELYFRIKPFLPAFLRNLNRDSLGLSRFFFN